MCFLIELFDDGFYVFLVDKVIEIYVEFLVNYFRDYIVVGV